MYKHGPGATTRGAPRIPRNGKDICPSSSNYLQSKFFIKKQLKTLKVYVQGSASILTEADRTALFSNLEDILLVNAAFLEQLEERFKAGLEAKIGEIFLNNVSSFHGQVIYNIFLDFKV